MFFRYHRVRNWAGISAAALLLAGCAALPKTGPSGPAILKGAGQGQFDLVEVSDLASVPSAHPMPEFHPLPARSNLTGDSLAAGDVVSVTLFEVGARVFSGAVAGEGGFDPTAKGQKIGPLAIDQSGNVKLPYIGTVQFAGKTPAQVEAEIERRLVGQSEYPQAVVQVEAAVGSSVVVGGEVSNPGRIRLTGAHERLLDVITLAGGYRGQLSDLIVHVDREGVVGEGPLDSLTYSNGGGMAMEPGDRVEILRRPRSYSVLGTAGRVNRYDLPTRRTSLMEALALAGGPNDNLANPAAIFVFRFAPDGAGGERATVYHINMMKPSSYFIAQKFNLDDKDVLYLAGAEANQPIKVIQLIGQLFTPVLIARQLAN